MRTGITLSAWLFTLSVTAATQQPVTLETLKFSEPSTIAEIDTDNVKGQPARLAWSPDGRQLYLQMLEGQFGQAGAKSSHHSFDATTGRRQDLRAEPEWASAYWTIKSGQASPDDAALKIELKSERRTERTVSTPTGGDLARGGSDPTVGTSAGDAVSAAYSRQAIPVHSMFLRGELVGEFVNSVIVPGLTFGWGPVGTKVIAYVANKSGRVVVMDGQGAKKEVGQTKDAVLPAWSSDATRLAWLQKDGRRKFDLQVARVATP
jgi:hypothetical protein